MDATRTVLGDPPARGDALASALAALAAFAILVAVVDTPVPTVALGVGALLLVVLAAGAAYRGAGLPAALALAVLPAAGWFLGPAPAGGRVVVADALAGLGAALGVGVVGFALGVGARAFRGD